MKLVNVDNPALIEYLVSPMARLIAQNFDLYEPLVFDQMCRSLRSGFNSLKNDYDINGVIDDLVKNAKLLCTKSYPHQYFRGIGTRKAISIIRSGGLPGGLRPPS